MLGWPLVGYKPQETAEPLSEKLSEEDGYSVYRMQFEILPGLKMTGLFFMANATGKRPMVMVQHGGWGTPEQLCGIMGIRLIIMICSNV